MPMLAATVSTRTIDSILTTTFRPRRRERALRTILLWQRVHASATQADRLQALSEPARASAAHFAVDAIYQGRASGSAGPLPDVAALSNAKICFQSFFMLTICQPPGFACLASFISACGNVPTFVSGRPPAGP